MRLIDRDKGTRTRPMRLLVLGISRIGTSSLMHRPGGPKIQHVPHERVDEAFRTTIPALDRGPKTKYDDQGPSYGGKEFDKMFGDYDAVWDVPAVVFSDELLAAYPDAKVLPTVRDPDKSVASMQSIIYLDHSWSSWDWLAPYDTFIGFWRICDGRNWDAFLGEQ